MNLLIPTLLLIAMILIIRYMYNEHVKRKETKTLTDEQMFIIEEKAMYAYKNYKPHWDRFDTLKYVEFLEYKCSKGLI